MAASSDAQPFSSCHGEASAGRPLRSAWLDSLAGAAPSAKDELAATCPVNFAAATASSGERGVRLIVG
ncbi:MAG: hypothetical protein ACTHOU_14725, partial [Aureliella sp.]